MPNPRALLAVLAVSAFGALASHVAAAERAAPPAGAELYFIAPMNGAQLTSPVRVQFGLRGMGVAPAGVEMPDTGHHHLLVNADPLPDLAQPLPSSDSVRHFGKGQTETELELAPGTYTLQLVLGDARHVPFDPPLMSGTITITVLPD
ncbi:MAG: DUF4399 domain-containing protein [Gammaproteobacteria bacterium]